MNNLSLHRQSFAITVVLAITGCATSTSQPTTRSPAEIVANASGKKFSASDDIIAGVQLELFYVNNRCRSAGGQLVHGSQELVRFKDRRGSGREIDKILPRRFTCKINEKQIWGLDVAYQNTQFLAADYIGSGAYYYGTISTNFISEESLKAEASQKQNKKTEETEYRNRRLDECAALRAQYRSKVQANPQPGMLVASGMIVEVRGSIALIQYDALGRLLKGMYQEWVPVATLGPGEDCPR